MVAATFSGALGAVAVNAYKSYIDYYSMYGSDTSNALGFLLFGTFALVSAAFGITSGVLTLTGKRFKFSVLGTLLMLASALFTFVIVWRYQYGFTDLMLFSAITIGALSLASTAFVIKAKTEFT